MKGQRAQPAASLSQHRRTFPPSSLTLPRWRWRGWRTAAPALPLPPRRCLASRINKQHLTRMIDKRANDACIVLTHGVNAASATVARW